MKKTLRSVVGLVLALVITSAGAQVGGFGLERAPASPAAHSSALGN